MKISTDPNYIKSSNLIFLSALLGVINLSLLPGILTSKDALFAGFLGISLVIVLGIMVRLGISWVKYLLLIMIILGLTGLPLLIKDLLSQPLSGSISLLQSIIQIYAVILLHKKSYK